MSAPPISIVLTSSVQILIKFIDELSNNWCYKRFARGTIFTGFTRFINYHMGWVELIVFLFKNIILFVILSKMCRA